MQGLRVRIDQLAELNLKLKGGFGYFKHAYPGQLGEIDGWIRVYRVCIGSGHTE